MQQGRIHEIDRAGAALSKAINCPIRYHTTHRDQFICKCGKIFNLFQITGALETGDWSHIKHHHDNGDAVESLKLEV